MAEWPSLLSWLPRLRLAVAGHDRRVAVIIDIQAAVSGGDKALQRDGAGGCDIQAITGVAREAAARYRDGGDVLYPQTFAAVPVCDNIADRQAAIAADV